MARKLKLDSCFMLRLTSEQLQRLREKASGANMPISVYVRVSLGLERRKKKNDAEEAESDEMRGVSDDTPPEAESA